jgi:phosphoserine phosphatase
MNVEKLFVPSLSIPSFEWSPEVAKTLLTIKKNLQPGDTVVFDFDHTCVDHDLGEAVFEVLVRKGLLSLEKIPPFLQEVAGVKVKEDLIEFYLQFLNHLPKNNDPLKATDLKATEEIYLWLSQIFVGLTPFEIISATKEVFSTPLQYFSTPTLRPWIVELFWELKSVQADIWIITAGNSWSYRWFLKEILNPQLIPADQIPLRQLVGLSNQLIDSEGNIFNDQELLRNDVAYALLDEEKLKTFKLSHHLSEPTSTFQGKAKVCEQILSKLPILAVGDSENDLDMLQCAQWKLFLERKNKEKLGTALRNTQDPSWMIQPVEMLLS